MKLPEPTVANSIDGNISRRKTIKTRLAFLDCPEATDFAL
jgi:hypothetical protein